MSIPAYIQQQTMLNVLNNVVQKSASEHHSINTFFVSIFSLGCLKQIQVQDH